MYAIYAYIGVVLGVNVGMYGSPMECLGIYIYMIDYMDPSIQPQNESHA